MKISTTTLIRRKRGKGKRKKRGRPRIDQEVASISLAIKGA